MGATHLIRIGRSVARHVAKECVTVTGLAQIPSHNSVDMAVVALDLLLTRCHVSKVAKVRKGLTELCDKMHTSAVIMLNKNNNGDFKGKI